MIDDKPGFAGYSDIQDSKVFPLCLYGYKLGLSVILPHTSYMVVHSHVICIGPFVMAGYKWHALRCYESWLFIMPYALSHHIILLCNISLVCVTSFLEVSYTQHALVWYGTFYGMFYVCHIDLCFVVCWMFFLLMYYISVFYVQLAYIIIVIFDKFKGVLSTFRPFFCSYFLTSHTLMIISFFHSSSWLGLRVVLLCCGTLRTERLTLDTIVQR